MEFTQKYRRKSPGRKALFIMGVLFFLLYFGLGLIFVFVKNLPFNMMPAVKMGFGVVLMVYALFRAVRLWQEFNNSEAR